MALMKLERVKGVISLFAMACIVGRPDDPVNILWKRPQHVFLPFLWDHASQEMEHHL